MPKTAKGLEMRPEVKLTPLRRDAEGAWRIVVTVHDTDVDPSKYLGSGYVVWPEKPDEAQLEEAVKAEVQRHVDAAVGITDGA